MTLGKVHFITGMNESIEYHFYDHGCNDETLLWEKVQSRVFNVSDL